MGAIVLTIKMVLLSMTIVGAVGLLLLLLYRDNRLLFWCVLAALTGHLVFAVGLWTVNLILSRRPAERFVEIKVTVATPEPPKVEPPKKPEPERKLDLPLGRPDGKRNVTKIKKGSTLDPKAREGAKGAKTFGNRHMIATATDGPGDIAYDPDAEGEILGPGDSLDPRDLFKIGTGGGGDDWGIPDGDPDGGVPAGFPNGKIGGRVYFVRMKYGTSSAWFAYNDGTKRLLNYLNKTFPCQTDTWPMTPDELKKRYMSKGAQPTFLYIYCDEGFKLNGSDVSVLREYMDKGGFLFLDSRPDPVIRDIIARELDKILPGIRLSTISGSHAINSFLYRLDPPGGIGENILEKRNYGVTRDGRLIVFYTPGNFAHIYSAADASVDPFVAAQYQMGANVMLYAITKGNPAGFARQQGARAVVTTQALEQLGLLKPEIAKPTGPAQPGETVKVKPTPPPSGTESPDTEMVPDDIKLLDE